MGANINGLSGQAAYLSVDYTIVTTGMRTKLEERMLRRLVLFTLVCSGGVAHAVTGEIGPVEFDINTRLTTGLVWRAQERDPGLISKLANDPTLCEADDCMSFAGDAAPNQRLVDAPGLFSGVNLDDGNINYDKGDIVSATTYATPELTAYWGGFKFRASALAFYDPENVDFDETHLDDRWQEASVPRPAYVERDFASDIELRELYVQRYFNLFDREVSVQIGRQVVPWGEATLTLFNSVNELNPLDATIAGFPGFELGQVNQPAGMAVFQTALTDSLAAEFVYQFEFVPVRIQPPGSFLSTNDLIGGTDYAMITLGQFNDDPDEQYVPPATGAGLISSSNRTAAVRPEREARDQGQFGMRLSYFASNINNGTEFGFYYLRYHSRLPLVSVYATDESCLRGAADPDNILLAAAACGLTFNGILSATDNPDNEPLPIDTLDIQVEYPEDIDMFGLSFNTNVGNWAFSGELSHRRNLPVQVHLTDVIFAGLQPAFPEQDIPISLDSIEAILGVPLPIPLPDVGLTIPSGRSAVPDYLSAYRGITVGAGDYVRGYERVDATQLSLAGLRIWSNNPFGADSVLFLLEGGFWYQHDMPDPQELPFQGTGDFTHPSYGADGTGTAPDGVDRTLSLNPTQQTTGLPTDFAWGYRALLRLTYNEILRGVTYEPQFLWFHDVQGQTPTPILNFTERRKALTFNNLFKIGQSLSLGATYQWYMGGGVHNLEQDRDFYNLYAVFNF